MITEPKILLHPNIPKPLHGLNPRSIMGQEWWDVERRKAYASTDFHCLACGVEKHNAIIHSWLEAHEYYSFNYSIGRIKIEKIIPLCHACHCSIHNGKLMKDLFSSRINDQTFWRIVRHGVRVLESGGAGYNPFMLNVVRLVSKSRGIPEWANYLTKIPPDFGEEFADIPWEDWRLEFNGKLYSPIYKSYEEWKDNFK